MTIQNDDTNEDHRDPHDSAAKRSKGRTGLYRHFRGLKNDDTTSVHDLDSRTCPRARAFPLVNEHFWRSLVMLFRLFNLDLYRHFAEITIFCPLRNKVISTGYTQKLGTRAPNLLINQQIRCTHILGTTGYTRGYNWVQPHKPPARASTLRARGSPTIRCSCAEAGLRVYVLLPSAVDEGRESSRDLNNPRSGSGPIR